MPQSPRTCSRTAPLRTQTRRSRRRSTRATCSRPNRSAGGYLTGRPQRSVSRRQTIDTTPSEQPTQVIAAGNGRPEPDEAPPDAPPPKLAPGIELVGEFEGSGFKEAPYIVRRADGQVVQLPRLLYLVAESIDGQRGYEE